MQVQRKDKSTTQAVLTVMADEADLAPYKQRALRHLARHVKVPGFRAGKAPQALIEKQVDQRSLIDEFLQHALNALYEQAVAQQKLRPVALPKVNVKKFVPFSTLEFEAEITVVGQIKLPNYKQIKLLKSPVKVAPAEVDEVVQALLRRAAKREEVERAAKLGDEVVIDFEGTDEAGQPISGAKGKDYPLSLGSQTFIPGFEDNVIGLKTGETKRFSLTFPKDYSATVLQGKKVNFEITIKKVYELKEPKLDAAFAAQAGNFKDVNELKADVKNQVTAEKQLQADRQFETELVRKIAQGTSVDIPASLIDEEVRRMEETERQNLTYRGQTWQEHLAEEGISEEQHRQRHRPEAEERIKVGLALSEIAEAENIQITPEELEVRLQLLKGQYKDEAMRAELDKPENRREIVSRLLTEKTLAKLKDYTTSNK